MGGSFPAQLGALCWKNWIILWRHKWINLFRCVILPVAYAAFFAKAQDFFTTGGVYGPGSITSLQPLSPNLLGHKLVWVPPKTAATNTTISTFVNTLMSRVLAGLDESANVVMIANSSGVTKECPENFNLLSECFAAVVFNKIDPAAGTMTYTLRGDYGLVKVNVDNPTQDDVQNRYLPLQWAIESNFINMTSGVMPPSPLTWEYTNESAADRAEDLRMSYLSGIHSLIVLAFFLVFLGVVYQLPGSMAFERANSLTSHLDAMGCRKSARIISWHLSISGIYLPAWICIAVIFQHFIFTHTNAGLLIVTYIITGLTLASWTYLVAVPFANAPTLAAITATFIAIVLAIGGHLAGSGIAMELVLTLIFPPMFYIFTTKSMAAFEMQQLGPNMLQTSPNYGDAPILALIVVALVDVVLFPILATWLENAVYGVRAPDRVTRTWYGRQNRIDRDPLPDKVAVEIAHLHKAYSTKRFGIFGGGRPFVAIEDLSFSVPKGGIFCLLGRNGAAKSTTLSAIARLLNINRGSIRYADDLHIGIASQKDVLWDELTCRQHIALWRAIKTTKNHKQEEKDIDLLTRCDLGPKVGFLSKNLSGGQKRKLQLACALAGGSNLLLLDEISSGLDPLSRRAIWKLITANRGKTTIVLTTHFLDEADYLGDQVAILQQPGKLLALDNPVALKTQLGRGYTFTVEHTSEARSSALYESLRADLPSVMVKRVRGKDLYMTGSNDLATVRALAQRLSGGGVNALDVEDGLSEDDLNEKEQGVVASEARYQINSATLEEVFLDLNAAGSSSHLSTTIMGPTSESEISVPSENEKDIEAIDGAPLALPIPAMTGTGERGVVPVGPGYLALTPGKHGTWLTGSIRASWIIFRKRLLVFRRSWLLPLVAITVVICATCIPLFFISSRVQTCANVVNEEFSQGMTYPWSIYPYNYTPSLLSPSSVFGRYPIPANYSVQVADNSSFVSTLQGNISGITFGGVSLSSNPQTSASLFAWEASPLEGKGMAALNFLTNAVYDIIKPTRTPQYITSDFRIILDFEWIPSPSFESTAQAFKWLAFFGLGIAIWPAFASVYPTIERASNVRANQYSNGANPAALWLGHLLFELPGILLASTIIIIVFTTASSQFTAIGYLWISFVLYGISSTLYAYLFALFLGSPLASWALVAGSNVILFLLYLATYLLIDTYDRTSGAAAHMTICHFTIALINPVPSMMRAALVSINLFSLLCNGVGGYSSSPFSSLLQFGGPILYMVVQTVFAFSILVYVDSGLPIPSFLRRRKIKAGLTASTAVGADVEDEKARVAAGRVGEGGDDLLVKGLSKKFRGNPKPAVDGVSFGVSEGQTFALIGPNGAGKTTTLACIRGVEFPTMGDVVVSGHSIVKARNKARAYLGVCPQVNAIDPQLTVRQHLWLYGRLKGVPSRALRQDISNLLSAAGLTEKTDALATSLSGGNQRKLSLAIALIGDRPVILIDEFSSGVDPFSKREAWVTLAGLTRDRAVLMTTHSMEEVDALATRVGIIASRMLAVGTPASLKSRFATYEVHLSATHVSPALDHLQAQGFPDAYRSLDTVTRISVPGVREGDLNKLLRVLEEAKNELGLDELTLQEASTETAFLSIVREHNIQEEEGQVQQTADAKPWWRRVWGMK